MNKTPNTPNKGDAAAGGPEELLQKLRVALQKDGDFPASAKIVNELRMLTSDPKTTASQITELILAEPSLGVRILHLVNSTFYRRAKPIMTVSQAVIQLGMKPIAEMCANLVLLQKFVPAAREGGLFANCLKRTVLTSILSSSIGTKIRPSSDTKNSESGFLAGSFAELGTLLLAYYFPQLYANAAQRAEQKKQDIARSIKEITGVSTMRLSQEVLQALGLPAYFQKVMAATESVTPQDPPGTPAEIKEINRIARGLVAALAISENIVAGDGKTGLDAVVMKILETTGIQLEILDSIIKELPVAFESQCQSIDLKLPPLPAFIATYSSTGEASESADPTAEFADAIAEIQQAVANREPPTSVITTVMETMAWGMQYDRVLLLVVTPTKKQLLGRMMLGKAEGVNPAEIVRDLSVAVPGKAPDSRAIKEGKPVHAGDPILKGGFDVMAIPIGLGTRNIGVIYADRLNPAKAPAPSNREATLGVLTELLDRAIANQAR